MDFKQIQSIIKDFENSNLTTLELEFENFKLKLSKDCPQEKTSLSVPKIENKEMIKPILHQIPIYIITIKYFPALHTFSDSIPSYGIPICPSYVPQMPNHP